MSKTSNNSQSISNQDDDILPEYDFSQGVRGRHRHRKMGLDLPGVQFLTNAQGQKTAVLINLQIHSELWQQVLSQSSDNSDFQFLIDTHNHSVFLDFKEHLKLWQTVYDRLIAQQPDYNGDRAAES